jgi:hypothetical protein
MQVFFPNPYGYVLPGEARVLELQKIYAFSDEYAHFLLTQNGLDFQKMEIDSSHTQYLVPSKESSEGCAELLRLYALDADVKYHNLHHNAQDFIFKQYLFPIGVDYGGNEIVEVLAGRFKGCIASLDHEMYASSDSLEEFADEFNLENFDAMSADEKADALMDEDIMAWIISPSMRHFTQSCVHCDDHFNGFMVEHPALKSSKSDEDD